MRPSRRFGPCAPLARLAPVVAAIVAAAGCQSDPPRARQVTPTVTRDVPAALRGTVGSEASLRNNEAVLVSGYGLVVGLRGTGGGPIPDRIAVTMERELSLRGIGRGSTATRGTPLEGISPRELLRSRDTAVVVVYGSIIPGAPEGASFDIYVTPVSQQPDLSLEGGTLWTTSLRLGPPTPLEGIKTTEIAAARGPVFVNPFAEGDAAPTRRMGRVLGGGVVTRSLNLQLVLDNESHSRARAIAEAINNRFGRMSRAGEELVARGRTPRSIELIVPPEYRNRAGDFLNLVTAVQIEQGFPQEFAKRYTDALRSDPYLANELSWTLEALPQRAAVPFLRELYDSGDQAARLAALRAGAALNDPRAIPSLSQLAERGPTASVRAEAISLLGRITGTPAVDEALRAQLAAEALPIRVAAYEALAQRAENTHAARLAEARARLPMGAASPDLQVINDARSELALPGDTVQGVERDVFPGRFLLDRVRGGDPLVYVTQQGRPRIVLFGEDLEVIRPLVFTMWDDRLMLAADGPTDEIRVRFRQPDITLDDGEKMSGESRTGRAPAELQAFISYLAQQPSPEDPRPGLGLGYSEIVGVLHELQRRGAITASFAIEEDLLQARLLAAMQREAGDTRPETPAEAERRLKVMEPVREVIKPGAEPPKPEPLVVPLPPVQRK